MNQAILHEFLLRAFGRRWCFFVLALALLIITWWGTAFSRNKDNTPFEPSRPFQSSSEKTIWDIGFHDGRDSLYYLSLPENFSVVAFEANPTLVSTARNSPQFAPFYGGGRLKLFNIGVRSRDDDGQQLTFYVNANNSEWSSFDQQLGCRTRPGRNLDPNPSENVCARVKVPTKTCAELFASYGTSNVYLAKCDIEGRDWDCLRDLESVPFAQRPLYFSVEEQKMGSPTWWKGRGASTVYGKGNGPAAAEFIQSLMIQLGYTGLKRVAQHNIDLGRSVGRMPEQVEDVLAGVDWSGFRPREAFETPTFGKFYDWVGKKGGLPP